MMSYGRVETILLLLARMITQEWGLFHKYKPAQLNTKQTNSSAESFRYQTIKLFQITIMYQVKPYHRVSEKQLSLSSCCHFGIQFNILCMIKLYRSNNITDRWTQSEGGSEDFSGIKVTELYTQLTHKIQVSSKNTPACANLNITRKGFICVKLLLFL